MMGILGSGDDDWPGPEYLTPDERLKLFQWIWDTAFEVGFDHALSDGGESSIRPKNPFKNWNGIVPGCKPLKLPLELKQKK